MTVLNPNRIDLLNTEYELNRNIIPQYIYIFLYRFFCFSFRLPLASLCETHEEPTFTGELHVRDMRNLDYRPDPLHYLHSEAVVA